MISLRFRQKFADVGCGMQLPFDLCPTELKIKVQCGSRIYAANEPMLVMPHYGGVWWGRCKWEIASTVVGFILGA